MTASAAPASMEQAWSLVLATLRAAREGTSPPVVSKLEQMPTDIRELLDLFLPLVGPLAGPSGCTVIAQLGQSLDGRIATVTGKSRYINGDGGLLHLHRLRAVSDAVVVGSGTAAADNPGLTVRLAEGPNPVRVLIDRRRRVPASHDLFTDEAAPTLHLVAGKAPLPDPEKLTRGALQIPCLSDEEGPIKPAEILRVLSHFGLRRVFVEGGGQTVSTFLQAGLVDQLHVMVAPMIIGSGQAAFTLREIDSLKDALRPSSRMVNLGSDMLFALDFQRNG